MKRGVLLLILDGWGMAPSGKGNAISLAKKPNFDYYWSTFPHTTLIASGEAVGLPVGQMGNSEVGHLNIGAGRIIWQDLPRITKSIEDGDFFKNPELKKAFDNAREHNKKLHLLGLVSPGGVHSHQKHLYALLKMAKDENVKNVFVHVITDGRDTEPESALKYIQELEEKINEIGVGLIATVCGRYYAMDRDKRWDRTLLAYNAIVCGRGLLSESAQKAIKDSYRREISDEFIKPTIINQDGLIESEDSVIFFNLRSDRPRQLSRALVEKDFNDFRRDKILSNLCFVTMTEYAVDLPVSGVAFKPEKINNCLAEVISKRDLRQFHIAETEKYAHVTFYFNGGQEVPFSGEERLLVDSPKVATYNLKPQMSAEKVSTKLAEKIGFFDFILVNFANPDMVGHTGMIPETIKAIETIDACLGAVVQAAQNMGYNVIITADHGNAEKMINADGSPCTSHTTNPVPLILISKNVNRFRKDERAKLGNIAPTILELMEIEKPKEMTEKSLLIS